jgi:predicted nucleic acid-binding protein
MNDNFKRQFIDTNVLVYAHDRSAGKKYERARKLLTNLWESRQGCISIQVLQEFYVTVVQKIAKPILTDKAARIITDLKEWNVHIPDVNDILYAIDIQQRNKLSFWDSLIICSAKKLNCDVIWSEDLNDGQYYEEIVVINPFEELSDNC